MLTCVGVHVHSRSIHRVFCLRETEVCMLCNLYRCLHVLYSVYVHNVEVPTSETEMSMLTCVGVYMCMYVGPYRYMFIQVCMSNAETSILETRNTC